MYFFAIHNKFQMDDWEDFLQSAYKPLILSESDFTCNSSIAYNYLPECKKLKHLNLVY